MPFLLLSDHSLFALRTLPPIVCLRVCVRVLLVECVLPGLTVLVLATSPLSHGTILASACAACASSFRSRVRRCCFESLPAVPVLSERELVGTLQSFAASATSVVIAESA